MVMQTTGYLSTVSGVVSTQHSLILGAGPYCALTVQDQRSSYRTSTVGLPITDIRAGLGSHPRLEGTMREELPGLHWMVPLCNGIMVDAVHPQSGKYQTACATVQGHMEYSEVVVFRRYNKGERLSSYLAMVTASFTMAKSMNAVVTMGAINAVYLS